MSSDIPDGFNWPAALDAVNRHDLVGAEKVREFFAAMGITGLPLSPQEREEAGRLRVAAARAIASAEAIEARANAAAQ